MKTLFTDTSIIFAVSLITDGSVAIWSVADLAKATSVTASEVLFTILDEIALLALGIALAVVLCSADTMLFLFWVR